jgi:ABC-type Mn2+/Zn2+ transport system permease subunit
MGAALFGLAMILGLAGWAFHASGDQRMRFRRDLFLGIAAGTALGLGIVVLWR